MISPILSTVRPANFTTLKLIWRARPHTLRLVVGTLRVVDDTYSFVYDGCDLATAVSEGFHGYPGMEMLESEFNGQAMNSFASRIPSRERPDIDQILSAWGANKGMPDFQILGLTFGRLPTDMFELIPEIPVERDIFYYTNLAGLQHYAHPELFQFLPIGTALSLEMEPGNAHDCDAVKVMYDGKLVAFIKRVHCESVCEALKAGITVDCNVVRIRLNGVIDEVVTMITYS